MRRSKVPVLPGQQLLIDKTDFDGPTGLVALEALEARARKCSLCEMAKDRRNVVFGKGPWDHPKVAIVGEAPGSQEDERGEPFVGRSGALLSKMLKAAGLDRSALFVTNAVLCRPPDNRTPTEGELQACRPFFEGQLRAVSPSVILALGRTAASRLTGSQEAMNYLRGKWHRWEGIPVRVSWHPAYILRRDGEDGGRSRWEAWDDLCAVLEYLGLPVPERTRHGGDE